MADEGKNNKGLEPKQGALTAEDLKAPKRLRVAGFSGSYRGVVFNGGLSEGPVPQDIADELRTQYPNAEIEEVADEPQKPAKK